MTYEQSRECQLMIMDIFRSITVGYGVSNNTRKRCGTWVETWVGAVSFQRGQIEAEMQAWIDVIKMDPKIMLNTMRRK